jgi:hypothetical protein
MAVRAAVIPAGSCCYNAQYGNATPQQQENQRGLQVQYSKHNQVAAEVRKLSC